MNIPFKLNIKDKLHYLKPIAFFLIVTIIVTYLISYVVTNGAMNFLDGEIMGINYINTLDNLKVGRFDLDRKIVGSGETSTINGKVYMYFGVFPALFRGFIELFFERGHTDWSKISVIFATLMIFWSSVLSYYKLSLNFKASVFTRFYYLTLFAVSILFASPVLHILSCAYIYHEAIIWGLAWCSIFICLYIYMIHSDKFNPRLFLFMSFACGFGYLSRHPEGSTTLTQVVLILIFLLYLINLKIKNKKLEYFLNKTPFSKFKLNKYQLIKGITFAILPLILCLTFTLKVNYERWGNPFNFYAAYEYYDNFKSSPWRLESAKEWGPVLLWRIPGSFMYYFIPTKEHFKNSFPFIKIETENHLFHAIRKLNSKNKIGMVQYDYREPGNPLIINGFAVFILSLFGLFGFRKTFGLFGLILAVPFFLVWIFILSYWVITLRYNADFMMLLIVLSLASFPVFVAIENKNRKCKILIRVFVFLITLIGVCLSTITMLEQKLFLWGVPGTAKNHIRSFYEKITTVKNTQTLDILLGQDINLLNLAPGTLWTPDKKKIFWFNGEYWLPVSGEKDFDYNPTNYGPIKMKIKFGTFKKDKAFPIVVTGKEYSGDYVYSLDVAKDKIVLGSDHWGFGGSMSKPINIDRNKFYDLEVSFGNFYPSVEVNNKHLESLEVKINGKSVFTERKPFFTAKPEEIYIGKNPIMIGAGSNPVFEGEIKEITRNGLSFP